MDCRKYSNKYADLKRECIDALYELMETYKVKEINLEDYEDNLDDVYITFYDDDENCCVDRLVRIKFDKDENGNEDIHLASEDNWSAWVEKYYCDGMYAESIFELYEIVVECIEGGYYTKSE